MGCRTEGKNRNHRRWKEGKAHFRVRDAEAHAPAMATGETRQSSRVLRGPSPFYLPNLSSLCPGKKRKRVLWPRVIPAPQAAGDTGMKGTHPLTYDSCGHRSGDCVMEGGGGGECCLAIEVWQDSHTHTAHSLAFFVTVPWPAPRTQQDPNGRLMERLWARSAHGAGGGMCLLLCGVEL